MASRGSWQLPGGSTVVALPVQLLGLGMCQWSWGWCPQPSVSMDTRVEHGVWQAGVCLPQRPPELRQRWVSWGEEVYPEDHPPAPELGALLCWVLPIHIVRVRPCPKDRPRTGESLTQLLLGA